MKKKELKKIAEKLSNLEQQRDIEEDSKKRSKIELEIMKITNEIENIEDLFILDDMILKILSKKS